MSTILTYLSTLKLSVQQWIILSGATLIGALVVALELQGTRLHKAQVDLLEANLRSKLSVDDSNVQAAQAAFDKALAEYRGKQG